MKVYKASEIKTFTDERGYLRDLLPTGTVVKSVLHCTGKPGAVRGLHVHKQDQHYCYVLDGFIEYGYQELGKNYGPGERDYIVLQPGDLVFTPTGETHKFTFMTDGAFMSLATEPRTQESYESDTIKKVF